MSRSFTKRYGGSSRDGRANLWTLTCPDCGTRHVPDTHMTARWVESCPKCGYEQTVDYNSADDKTTGEHHE